jgi:hypothetical protein
MDYEDKVHYHSSLGTHEDAARANTAANHFVEPKRAYCHLSHIIGIMISRNRF